MLVLRTLFFVLTACVWLNSTFGQAMDHANDNPNLPSKPTGEVQTDRKQAVVIPAPHASDAYQFIVYGDRTGGVPAGLKVLRQAVADTNLLNPDLVMTVGDLIQGYNDTPEWLDQMKEFKGIMGELGMSWFPVAGNHDIYWRGKGKAPQGHHESNYEKHFGPLWYSFPHKDCGFIVMYSDEGNAETNRKSFSVPELQMVSDQQLAFVDKALSRFRDKSHVFVFLHHPRWTGGRYTGNNWGVVHKKLVAAGNVSAVFAGHVHHLRYDENDGIEYHTLATTGGVLSGDFPNAGYLHHFNVVTVRPEKISVAAVPVGSVMDPKQFTADFLADFETARRIRPKTKSSGLVLEPSGTTSGVVEFELSNSCKRPVDVTLVFDAGRDVGHWQAPLGHRHFTLQPSENKSIRMPLLRRPGDLENIRVPNIRTQMEYLTDTARVELNEVVTQVPLTLDLSEGASNLPTAEKCLVIREALQAIKIPNDRIRIPSKSPLTLEARVSPIELKGHNGIIAKTENSGYALFSREGVPEFSIHIGGRYVNVKANQPLAVNKWSHLAGVYDGSHVKLFVDGKIVAKAVAKGDRRVNQLPLYIGADPDRRGLPTRPLKTLIDDVRLTPAAVYTANFQSRRDYQSVENTLLWIDFNQSVGPLVLDRSQGKPRSLMMGPNSKLVASPD